MRSLMVGLGGGLGAAARWGVSEALPTADLGFPWATLLVNVTGAFLLGWAAVMLIERVTRAENLRPFLLVGMLGSYTTFSTLAVEGVLLIEGGRPGLAFGYMGATMVLGLAAGLVGISLARSR